MQLTTRIKLYTDPDSRSALLETMRVFNLACQHISDYAFEHQVFHKHNLQDRLYTQIKGRFCLPSQLIVRAFAKVGDAYKTQKTQLLKRLQKYNSLSKEKQALRKAP